MKRALFFLAAVAATAQADRDADLACAHAIRDFNWILVGRSADSMDSVRDRIVANLKNASAKVAKSIRFQLDRGYKKKYKADAHTQKCIAEMLASGGRLGILQLQRRYKASRKRDDLRLIITRALAACGDDEALDVLLKIMHDKLPEVAAAAIEGCGAYAKVKPDRRKKAMREIIDRYSKVTDGASGKEPDSTPMHLYRKVKEVADKTLSALSGGEKLDSATAWDAWLRENITGKWPE